MLIPQSQSSKYPTPFAMPTTKSQQDRIGSIQSATLSSTLRVNRDSPNGAIPLEINLGDVGYVETALNGKSSIICWDSWNVCRDRDEYGE